MIFPVTDLLSASECETWIERHFHPDGFKCLCCGAPRKDARHFRISKRGLVDWRCGQCQSVYNLYSGTIFSGSGWGPAQVLMLLRGVCKGESSKTLATELGVSRPTVHSYRRKLQAKGYAILSQAPLPDSQTETDEMFQNAGEKKRSAPRPQ